MRRPAIFLDRDGVINENLPGHVCRWEDFRFLPGTFDALRELGTSVPIVIITNQGAIGRQLVSQDTVELIHRRMVAQIRAEGGDIAGIIYCPHPPEARCRCRKPSPGMLLAAAARFNLDLRRSVFVGDALTDVEAGYRAGCRTILVRTGRGEAAVRELASVQHPRPAAIVDDLRAAVPAVSHLFARRAARLAQRPTIAPPLRAEGEPATALGAAS
jgi:D-glycero-D-manno-heptose 1,7-bisphosphate phosphatase